MKIFFTLVGVIGLTLSCSLAQENYEQISQRFDAHIANMIKQGELNNQNVGRRESVDATFTMTNAEVTNDGSNDFFEFDIEVFGNTNDIYFDNALFRIDYSGLNGNSVFGDSVAKRGNIETTYGPMFNDVNTYEPHLYQDVDSQAVALIAGVYFMAPGGGAYNRALLPQAPVQLLHVKIKMVDCGKDVALSYHDDMATLPSFFWSYTETADAGSFSGTAFDNTTFIDSIGLYSLSEIAGQATVCQGTEETYSIEIIESASGYEWTLTPGETLNIVDNKVDLELAMDSDISVKGVIGCGFSHAVSKKISVDEMPIANAGADTLICENHLILFANEPHAGEGNWSSVAGEIDFVNAHNATISKLPIGITTATWTVENGVCPSAVDIIEIDYNPSSPNCVVAGIEFGLVRQFVIAPNPASDLLTIDIDENITQIKVLTSNGAPIFEQVGNGQHNEIDLNALEPGIYIIQAISNKSIYSGSFVKN